MNTSETEKYNAYKKLMWRKRLIVLSITMFGVVTAFLLEVLQLPVFVIIIAIVIYVYIGMFIFLAKNVCPWCKLPFFLFGHRGLSGNGIHFLFQKTCINCGKPNEEDINEKS